MSKTSDLMRPAQAYDAVIKQREIDGKDFGLKYAQFFVEVACPACGAKGKEVFKKYNFQHRLCDQCKTLFCSPRPGEEYLAIYYTQYPAPHLWTELLLKADVERKALQYQPRVEKIIDLIKKNGGHKGGKAVDLGAGSGAFSVCLRQADFYQEVLALDLSPACVEACRQQGLSSHLGRIEDLPALSADLICMNDLIEHIFNPLDLLKACYRVLRPGGFISIATPNGEGFDFKILKENTGNVTPPEHLTYFNPHSLSLIMGQAGFKTIQVETPGKLDVDIIAKAKAAGFPLQEKNEFLGFLFEQDESVLNNFQKFLADNGLSSHMLILGKKM